MLHARDLGEGPDRELTMAVLRGDVGGAERSLAGVHPRRLIRIWDRQGIAGRVQRRAFDLGLLRALPGEAVDWLHTRSLADWAQAQRHVAEAERIGARLDANPHAFVGDPLRGLRVHGVAGQRAVDRLVMLLPRSGARPAMRELRADGWSTPRTMVSALAPVGSDAVELHGHDVSVELRWSVRGLPGAELDAIRRRADDVPSGGITLRAAQLGDELLLTVLAAHAAHEHGALGLGALDALLTLAATLEGDGQWTDCLGRWTELDLDRMVAAMLLLAGGIIGGLEPLPDVTAALEARRPALGRLGDRLGLARLLPQGMDARDRLQWAGLRAGGALRSARGELKGRLRANALHLGEPAWRRAVPPLMARAQAVRVDRARRALHTAEPSVRPAMLPGRVFVSVAAFRDPDCRETIRDLFAKARHPDRISVGLCLQVDDRWDVGCEVAGIERADQIRVRRTSAADSLGVCWARAEAQRLWRGEEFVLQIDSHSRFVAGWDELAIDELTLCDASKPVLTGYPPGYRLDRALTLDARPYGFEVHDFSPGGAVRTGGTAPGERPDRPEATPFVAGGFLFSRADLICDVPYDPYLAFDHEEVALALRLFTHGWDAFVPRDTIAFHLYGGDKPKDHRRRLAARPSHGELLARRSQERFDHLVGYRHCPDARSVAQLDRYGLGTVRSIEEFEERSGIEFWSRSVHRTDADTDADADEAVQGLAEVIPLHPWSEDRGLASGERADPINEEHRS